MASTSRVVAEPDFDWLAPGALGPGYLERLQSVQQIAPVAWSEHQQAWIVTRHADIVEGLKDRRLSNHRYHLALEQLSRATGCDDGELLKTVRQWIFNQDGPDHTRLRLLLMKPFSKSAIDGYREPVRESLVQALEPLAQRSSFDFVNELAFPFVSRALLSIIGLSHLVTPEQLGSMSRKIVAALVAKPKAADIVEADRVIATLTPAILKEIEARRRSPQNDLLTGFVTLSENGDRLSEKEIITLFQVLMLAAIDTTTYTLSLMIPVLDASAAHREYIRTHRGNLQPVVEELQRYVGMMNMMHRIAAEDFEWHGQQIRAGDMVYLMLAAGNHDPAVYENPNTLDFDRKRKLPLMFAPGLHHCIGHFIAKMELEVALAELFTRFDRVRVLEAPEFLPNYMTIGLPRLAVRLERLT
jgi:cytochrome P450 PksS